MEYLFFYPQLKVFKNEYKNWNFNLTIIFIGFITQHVIGKIVLKFILIRIKKLFY